MTHLILHKVRGEPAFDIAEQMENGMWIIPTSGHRAYPYWTTPLVVPFGLPPLPIPVDHPDHYSINDQTLNETTDSVNRKVNAKRTLTLDDLD